MVTEELQLRELEYYARQCVFVGGKTKRAMDIIRMMAEQRSPVARTAEGHV